MANRHSFAAATNPEREGGMVIVGVPIRGFPGTYQVDFDGDMGIIPPGVQSLQDLIAASPLFKSMYFEQNVNEAPGVGILWIRIVSSLQASGLDLRVEGTHNEVGIRP